MDDMQNFRRVLFYIIAFFFAIITLLTILSVFFGVGQLSPEFQSKAFYAFIIEVGLALFALFYAVFGLKKGSEKAIEPLKHNEVLPARKDVAQSEIESAANNTTEFYTGPDRSYLINLPPATWKIKEDTMHNLQIEALEIKNPVLVERIRQSSEDFADVVSFIADKDYWFLPKPGQTIMNESILLSAKDFHFRNSLMIVPMDRYRPPLYIYASAEKVLLEFIQYSKIVSLTDIKKIGSEKLKGTDRKIIEVEAVQALQNIIVNENEFARAEIHHHFFAIEGEKKHYVIRASYLTGLEEDAQTEKNKKILFDLTNSFRPLRVPDPGKEKELEKKKAYDMQKSVNEKAGEQIFTAELGLLLFQVMEMNIDNKDDLKKIMKLLKQFKSFFNQVTLGQSLHNDLLPLWAALDKADAGSTEDLKKEIRRVLQDVNAEIEKSNIAEKGATSDVLPASQLSQ